MNNYIARKMRELHRSESGAIMLLLMAAFLVLFMLAMTVYDTGVAARDKMDAQISADASAFTHSVVKSRSMNMISYANTIKRMFFTFAVTWVNGFTALMLVTAAHIALCARMCGPVPCPRLKSCWELIENFVLILAETIEAIFNVQNLGIIGGGSSRALNELEALEKYQQYMFKISPWWAWTENVMRSMDNGALVTASWPPPGSIIEEVKGAVSTGASTADWALGTDFMGMLPSHTDAVDVLPVARRDSIVNWSDSAGPFSFELNQGAALASIDYCIEWVGSLEMLMQTVQTATQGDAPGYEWWTAAFLFLQFAGGSAGCAIINFAWNQRIRSAHLDWKLNDPKFDDENTWLLSTSNFTYSYVPRAGRTSDDGDRKKYNIVNKDYGGIGATALYRKDGYFATARSEIVYKPAMGTDQSGFLGGLTGAIGSIPIIGSRLGVQPEPDMWSPRWTGRLRPMTLPGETWGAASAGDSKAGFNTVVTDTVPYLILASTLGVFDDKFSFGSGLNDLLQLWVSAQTMTSSRVEGFSK